MSDLFGLVSVMMQRAPEGVIALSLELFRHHRSRGEGSVATSSCRRAKLSLFVIYAANA
jgi:hypothetical protein